MKTKNESDFRSITAPMVVALKIQNDYPAPMRINGKRLGQWAGRLARTMGVQNLHYSEV